MRGPRVPAPLARIWSQSKSVLWTSGALAIAQVFSIATALISARLLGPTGKGLVTAVTTWAQLLSWVSVLGLATAAQVRIAPQGDDESGRTEAVSVTLGNSLAFALLFGVPVATVSAVVLSRALARLGPGAGTLAILAVAGLPLGILGLILSAIQIALGRRRIFNLAQITAQAVLLSVVLGLATFGALTPFRLLVGYVGGALCSLVVGGWGLPWASLRVKVTTLMDDIRFGIRVHLAGLLRLTSFRLDILIMSALVPAAQIGLYSAANSAMVPVVLLCSGSAALMTSQIAGLGSSRARGAALQQEQVAIIRRDARRYTLTSLLIGLGLAGLAPIFVPLVLGHAYGPVVRLIWILIPGYVCLGYSAIVAAGAAGMRRPWVGNVAEASGAGVTIALLPKLLSWYGAGGAAVTSTLAYSVTALVCSCSLGRRITRAEPAPPPAGDPVPVPEYVPLPDCVPPA